MASKMQAKNKKNSSLGKAPVAQARRVTATKPKIEGRSSNGDIRVRHREYIADVAGSVLFTATQLQINPGSEGCFPWLSQIARRFESYSFTTLKFYYESQAPTTATGTILLVLDYDAADAAPSGKVDAMSYRGSVRCAPWQESCHSSAKEDLHKSKSNYVRGDSVLAANLDIKSYDIGNLFVCTQGQAGTTAIGELYVEYDVMLLTPQLSASSAPSFKYTGAAGWTAALPWGTSGTADADNNILVTVNSGTQITFGQAFTGMMIVSCSSTGTTNTIVVGAGTATTSILVNKADGTVGSAVLGVIAAAGQTVILTWTGMVTPLGGSFRLAAYDVTRVA